MTTVNEINHRRRSRPLSWIIGRFAQYTVLIVFLLIFLIPFFWLGSMSLKTKAEMAENPLGLPTEVQWENYDTAWNQGRYRTYLPNTIFYAAAVVTGVCLFSCLAGYAFAKLNFPGRNLIFTFMLIGITLPFLSVMIPVFYLARDIGIMGTRWGYIIPAIALGLPFGVFLMRAFFQGLPDELGDSARVDGCTEWGVFWRVMLPLAGPGLTTLAVFQFLFTWTAYLMPLVLVQKDALRPVALALPLFMGRYSADLPLISAGTVITILPIVLMYLILQRKFIEGVTAGALK